MAPPHPKSRSRQLPAVPRRNPTVELPFADDDVRPLDADDPRPQRVAQYPANARKPARKAEEAIPTTVYDVQSHDEEFQPKYDPRELSDPYTPMFLYVQRGPGAGQLAQVRQGVMVVGRASVSELRLQHPSISRRHCQITRLGERLYLRDLGSQNGTFVNKTRIATEVEVQAGDEIAIGNALLKVRGPAQAAEAIEYQTSRRRHRRSNTTRMVMFGAAVGIGLAGVVIFAAVKVSKGPSYRELPTTRATEALAPATNTDPKVAIDADPVTVKIKKAMNEAREREAKAAAEADVAPAPTAPVKVASVAPAKRLTATRIASKGRSEEATRGGHNPQILSRYEDGDVEGALELARQENDKDMVSKLSKFLSAYDGAKSAIAAKDGTGALHGYTAALAADEVLSKGWGKYSVEIRKQLSDLYTLVGMKHLENEDSEDAQKAFAAAVKYNPENAKAKAQMAKLSGGSSATTAAPAPSKKAKIDDAWGDDDDASAPAKMPAKARTPAKPASRASAIDAAFGD